MQAEFETLESKPQAAEQQNSSLSEQFWDSANHLTKEETANSTYDTGSSSQSAIENLPDLEISFGGKNADATQAKCIDESCNERWAEEMRALRKEIEGDVLNLGASDQKSIAILRQKFPSKEMIFSQPVIDYLEKQGFNKLVEKARRYGDMATTVF